jgi:hypothetical protein
LSEIDAVIPDDGILQQMDAAIATM